MANALERLLQPSRLIEVVDIGANPIDGQPPYRPLMENRLCRVTGFEPQTDALTALQEKATDFERYLGYAIGDGDAHVLNICEAIPGFTSLLDLDVNHINLFDFFRPTLDSIRKVDVTTKKLDEIEEIEFLDFLKIDIQGGELSVFRNARNKLSRAIVVQTEVSFVTLYKNQASFGEIDIELRAQGFIPHCFAELKKWPIAPCVVNGDPRIPLNQLLEADIVYVRDFSHPEILSDDQLKHLALISQICYGSADLAMRCVMLLEQRGSLQQGVLQQFIDIFSQR